MHKHSYMYGGRDVKPYEVSCQNKGLLPANRGDRSVDQTFVGKEHVISPKNIQGSRLTFQLASPVASDRFYSLAKTKFSLARYSNIHHHIKSSKYEPV